MVVESLSEKYSSAPQEGASRLLYAKSSSDSTYTIVTALSNQAEGTQVPIACIGRLGCLLVETYATKRVSLSISHSS